MYQMLVLIMLMLYFQMWEAREGFMLGWKNLKEQEYVNSPSPKVT